MNKFRIGDKVIFNRDKNYSALKGKTGTVVKVYPLAKCSSILLDEPHLHIDGIVYENFEMSIRNWKLDFDPKYKKIKDKIRKEYTLKMLEVDPFREEVW